MSCINRLYIVTSRECNKRCSFCYVYNSKELKLYSLDIQKILNILKFNHIKQIVLIGGEPLLNGVNLKILIRYIRNLNKKVEIIITTNGTLINSKWISFFKKYKIYVQVTIYDQKLLEKILNIKFRGLFYHILLTENIEMEIEIIKILNYNNIHFWISVDRKITKDISDNIASMFIHDLVSEKNFRINNKVGKDCKSIYGNQLVINGVSLFNTCLNLVSENKKQIFNQMCLNCNNNYCDACICEGVVLSRATLCRIFQTIKELIEYKRSLNYEFK